MYNTKITLRTICREPSTSLRLQGSFIRPPQNYGIVDLLRNPPWLLLTHIKFFSSNLDSKYRKIHPKKGSKILNRLGLESISNILAATWKTIYEDLPGMFYVSDGSQYSHITLADKLIHYLLTDQAECLPISGVSSFPR